MPHLVKPEGYYTPEQARVAWLEHLEDVLASLVHIASVDAFQAWIYTNPAGGDAAARDAQWLQLRARFEKGVDWSGLENERIARWYRQLHIFELPFYYIEYGIAQLGALQVYRNATRNSKDAVAAYQRFLALGGTKPLPELYREAGVKTCIRRGDDAGARDVCRGTNRRTAQRRGSALATVAHAKTKEGQSPCGSVPLLRCAD
jgi:oligoendopeptidase F